MRSVSALLVLLVVLAPSPAWSDSDSDFTLGVGSGLLVAQSVQPGYAPESSIGADLNLRLKLFDTVAVDVRMRVVDDPRPAPAEPTGLLVFDAPWRLNAMLYPVPADAVRIYLAVGLGGQDPSELVTIDAPGNSYHLGAGLELPLNDHFSLDAAFYLVAPGQRSIRADLDVRGAAAIDEAVNRGQAPETVPGIDDYISASNFEVSVRALLFL